MHLALAQRRRGDCECERCRQREPVETPSDKRAASYGALDVEGSRVHHAGDRGLPWCALTAVLQ